MYGHYHSGHLFPTVQKFATPMLIFLTLKSLRASYTYNKSVFINAVTRNYQTSSGLRNYFFNKETERSWMFLVKFLVRSGFGEQTRKIYLAW